MHRLIMKKVIGEKMKKVFWMMIGAALAIFTMNLPSILDATESCEFNCSTSIAKYSDETILRYNGKLVKHSRMNEVSFFGGLDSLEKRIKEMEGVKNIKIFCSSLGSVEYGNKLIWLIMGDEYYFHITVVITTDPDTKSHEIEKEMMRAVKKI